MRVSILWITGIALLACALVCSALGGAKAERASDNLPSISITSTLGSAAHPLTPGSDGFITFTIAVQHFRLDGAQIGKKPNRTGSGHYHIYADHIDPSSPFKFWIMAGASTTVRISLAVLARDGVGPGIHTIYVVLANNDHTLIEPLAIAFTVVRVTPPPVQYGLTITSGAGTASNPALPGENNAFDFSVAAQHFIFDPAHIGIKPNRAGYGHYHIYADSIDPQHTFKYWLEAGATPGVQVTLSELAKQGISNGTHTIFVVLANNDHSLVQPLVMSSTVIAIGPTVHVAELSNPTQPIMMPRGGKVTLHVRVTDFRLDPRGIGAKINTQGAGHYHVYVNTFDPSRPLQGYVAVGAGSSVDVTAAALAKEGITSGFHAIYVVLANNDHSLVVPITSASGLIQVGG